LGAIGGLLFLAIYLLCLGYGLRVAWTNRQSDLIFAYALIALVGGLAIVPIMLTSDVWGNFSVTFLLWWVFGLIATLSQRARQVEPLTSRANWDNVAVVVSS
ncbi:MAG: hypothetical protein ACTHMJ_21230, partial [Thermomicrobiales bacterium]